MAVREDGRALLGGRIVHRHQREDGRALLGGRIVVGRCAARDGW